MAKKRYGKGGIYDDPQRPGHKIIQIPDGHGKYIRRRAVDAETAKAIYADLSRRVEAGLDVRSAARTLQWMTLEWRDKVLNPRQNSSRPFAPKTVADTRDTIARYLLPDWGNYRLEEFDVPLALTIHSTLLRRFSPDIAHRAIAKLRMLLAAAVRWGYLQRNAVDDARPDLPPLKREEKPALTIEETRYLFTVVENHRLTNLYHTALTLGLRLGELLGLQWVDIHWQDRTITIRRQAQDISGRKELRPKTKTPAGERVLPLPPRLYARLHAQWQAGVSSVFIFPNENGGLMAQGGFWRHWRGGRTGHKRKNGNDQRVIGMRQKVGLSPKYTPHCFRHTVGTRLMELNLPDEIRDAIMGHGKKGVRQLYTHVVKTSMKQALERLEHLLFDTPLDKEASL